VTVAEPSDDELEEIEVALLVEAVRRRYGYDFRGYAPASLSRRMREAIRTTAAGDFHEALRRVLREPDYFERLLSALTVTTSEMFRAPEVYAAIRDEVVPVLRTYPEIRVWHAGVGLGEEVYSLAILLTEAGLYGQTRVYGTDINPEALAATREGVYPADSLRDFTANYQRYGGASSFSDYYTAAHGFAAMRPALRSNATFSEHNLATDASFGKMHLVSCRNVLIYFGRELQARVVGLLKDSLVRRGYLVLGRQESLDFTGHADAFEEVCPGTRIYRLR